MSIYGLKNKAFAQIRELGGVKAVIQFSGGGDEGGADSGEVLTADGHPLKWDYKYASGHYDSRGNYVPDESDPISALADSILDDKFGSFAGDFYVHGEIVIDAVAKTVKMTGEESQMQPFETYDEDL